MEIITVQQANQNKTVPECWRMTENDSNKLSPFEY